MQEITTSFWFWHTPKFTDSNTCITLTGMILLDMDYIITALQSTAGQINDWFTIVDQ